MCRAGTDDRSVKLARFDNLSLRISFQLGCILIKVIEEM